MQTLAVLCVLELGQRVWSEDDRFQVGRGEGQIPRCGPFELGEGKERAVDGQPGRVEDMDVSVGQSRKDL
jgi:hypothetical protein